MVKPVGSPKRQHKRGGAKRVTSHRPTKEQQESKTRVKKVPPKRG